MLFGEIWKLENNGGVGIAEETKYKTICPVSQGYKNGEGLSTEYCGVTLFYTTVYEICSNEPWESLLFVHES